MRSIALLIPIVLASPALAHEPEGDLARLQGTWTTTGGPKKDLRLAVTIKDGKVEVVATHPDRTKTTIRGEIRLDEKARPKTLDWVGFVRADGSKVPENRGIYNLDGDTWTVCTGGPGNPRPAEFRAGEGALPNLNVWARARPDDAPIEGDLAGLQGSWTTRAGQDDEVTVLMTIKSRTLVSRWELDGAKSEMTADLQLDEKANPRTIDFLNIRRTDGEDARDILGIYALEGDKIKLCVGGPGNPRPAAFKAGRDGPPSILTWIKKPE